MKFLSKSNLAFVLILLSTIAYGSYTGIQKQGLGVISSPVEFAFYSMVYCSLFISPFAIRAFIKDRKKHSIKKMWPILTIVPFFQFITLGMKLLALTFTTATSVGFITSFSSVTLTLYAVWFLKEKLPKYFFLVLFLMCIGLALFKQKTGAFGLNFGIGELIMFVFIFFTSLSNTVAKMMMNKDISPFVAAFSRIFFSIPFFAVATLVTHNFSMHRMLSIWPMLAGGFFSVRLMTLYSAASLTKMSNLAIVNLIVPIMTFAYAFMFLGERLNFIQMLGAGIIVLGGYLMAVIKGKNIGVIEWLLVWLGVKRQRITDYDV